MEQLAYLSVRELDTLELAARGFTNKQIGKVLHVGEETIKTRLKDIFLKLNAKNRSHAVAIALRQGHIE